MKLALYQGPPPQGDVEAAFARLERLLAASAAAGARMLVAPELFLPGYNQPDLHGLLAQPLDSEWTARLARMTAAAGCGLTLGWAERDGAAVYNAASAFGPDGARLAHYRKIQLFGPMEAASFTPGPVEYTTFDFEGLRIGLLICYDIEFPVHAARLARAGAALVLVPTANPAGYAHVSDVLVPARASESRLTIAYANYTGAERGLSFGGGSVIVGPDARPLATAGAAEALLVVDLAAVAELPEHILSTQARDLREAASPRPSAP